MMEKKITKSRKPNQKEIDAFLADMMNKEPVKFIQCCCVMIGKQAFNGGGTFEFKVDADLQKGRRYTINVVGTITEII